MVICNHLLYCLWILTNTEIAVTAMGVPGLVGMGPEIDTNRADAVPILGRGRSH